MKIKSITVYTIVIAVVFALAILFFSGAVIREYQSGSNRTGAIFDHMVTGTKNAATTYQSSSTEFRATFEQLTGSLENYDSLVLSKNNLPIFVYPAGAIETATSGKFYRAYSNSFSVAGENYKITATMYLLRPSSVFHYARFAFFIVLMGTVLAVILLCYLYISKQDVVPAENDTPDEKSEDVYSNFFADFNPIPQPTAAPVNAPETKPETEIVADVPVEQPKTAAVADVQEDITEQKQETVANVPDEQQKTATVNDVAETAPATEQTQEAVSEKEIEIVEETPEPTIEAKPEPDNNSDNIISPASNIAETANIFEEPISEEEAFAKNYDVDQFAVEESDSPVSTENDSFAENTENEKPESFDSAPNGIFSPATGFCWEDHLEPRLDTELIRATASETDLSLILVRIPGLIFSEPLTKVICTYLEQQFQYSDLLFEYMPDGFAVIKEDMSLDVALSLAETVLAEINKIISGKGYNCYIGISTRADRILPGKRILLEASEALKHAISTGKESPIIAFKANDTKYREYIETHS